MEENKKEEKKTFGFIDKMQQRSEEKKLYKGELQRRLKAQKELKEMLKQNKQLEKLRSGLKKEKSEEYIMRKNTLAKISRVIIWAILIFIFAKGVMVSLSKDPTAEVNRIITTFKKDFTNYRDQDAEILAFAQNFTKEYLTYAPQQEAHFTQRITPYATDNILKNQYNFKNSAKVIYAQAYKKIDYSDTQTDVFVLVDVEYTKKELADAWNSSKDVLIQEQGILKVPIAINQNHYVVEDFPVFVNDSSKIDNYNTTSYKGLDAGEEITNGIKVFLNNFFKAYYEEDQSIINYYLTKEANQESFHGLNKRILFEKITNIKCYITETKPEIICIVTVSATDKNGVSIPQNYNLEIIERDGMYYIKSMDTRHVNLKYKMEEI